MQTRILACVLLLFVLLNFAFAQTSNVFERVGRKRSTCAKTGQLCDDPASNTSANCCKKSQICLNNISIMPICVAQASLHEYCNQAGPVCKQGFQCSGGRCYIATGGKCTKNTKNSGCIKGDTCTFDVLISGSSENGKCQPTQSATK